MAGRDNLHRFGAYTKALDLFDRVVEDLAPLEGRWALARLVAQQLASADSIVANIEEGYGRGSSRDYAHFLVIARGSAQETAGRYARFGHWLTPEIVRQRVALCDEIIGILTVSITTLRNTPKPGPSP
ncbi:MAG TPA: four helix bundle protein [Candidatus Didemnitutus sp.]|nr:four helix bundle protein [Candidatus Didemnitutus sp.]